MISVKVVVVGTEVFVYGPVGFGSCCSSVVCYSKMEFSARLSYVELLTFVALDTVYYILRFAVEILGERETVELS